MDGRTLAEIFPPGFLTNNPSRDERILSKDGTLFPEEPYGFRMQSETAIVQQGIKSAKGLLRLPLQEEWIGYAYAGSLEGWHRFPGAYQHNVFQRQTHEERPISLL